MKTEPVALQKVLSITTLRLWVPVILPIKNNKKIENIRKEVLLHANRNNIFHYKLMIKRLSELAEPQYQDNHECLSMDVLSNNLNLS